MTVFVFISGTPGLVGYAYNDPDSQAEVAIIDYGNWDDGQCPVCNGPVNSMEKDPCPECGFNGSDHWAINDQETKRLYTQYWREAEEPAA